MSDAYNRRQFLNQMTAVGISIPITANLASAASPQQAAKTMDMVRIGFVGVGRRGQDDLRNLLKTGGVEIRAICDVVESHAIRAQKMVTEFGQPSPKIYTQGDTDYKRLCARDDLDLVFTATPWRWHAPVCVEAMTAGKHAACEVPIAITLDECWQLVETAEKTGRYCIQMENCNYERVALMVLNMVRQNLLGDLLHARCGYLHDIRRGLYDGRNGLNGRKELWRLQHSTHRNGDLYPTHGLGPVAQCLNINRGNQFDHLVSMSTRSQGREKFAAAKYGPDSSQAKIKIVLGDVVTSIIRTHVGQTVVVTHDTSTPRPQSGDYMMQGTKGLVQDSEIYTEGKSPPYEWENLLEKYAAEYEHPLWRDLKEKAKGSGHGGMDFIQAYRLIYCLRNGLAMDIDVYDGAAICAVSELSERSIAGKSQTMDFPDFTRGAWKKRKPLGIVESGVEKA